MSAEVLEGGNILLGAMVLALDLVWVNGTASYLLV